MLGYIVTALGTAAFSLATTAWHVLVARASAWFGRGVRTPVRKALLAAAVTPETYGRAFGFERMMDTLGAIIAPATAYVLFVCLIIITRLFAFATRIPGLLAVAIDRLPRAGKRTRAGSAHFVRRTSSIVAALLPPISGCCWPFRRGRIRSHIVDSACNAKTDAVFGAPRAASIAVALYVLHNIFYAAFSYLGGWLADRFPKNCLLCIGYALAALMTLSIILLPAGIWTIALVFVLGGIQVALEETLEDSFCAELVDEAHHGMAFGVLATVNGVGDFLSSIIVGALWSAVGMSIAFGYSTILFIAGAILVARVKPSMQAA